MTPEQAQAIYFAGQEAVVTYLCELDAQVQALQQEIEALQRKIAQLSKNSSNSSKRPSSDDITKPKGGIFFWMRIPGVDTSALFQAANAAPLPGAGAAARISEHSNGPEGPRGFWIEY